jgi:hypothetical protein
MSGIRKMVVKWLIRQLLLRTLEKVSGVVLRVLIYRVERNLLYRSHGYLTVVEQIHLKIKFKGEPHTRAAWAEKKEAAKV